MHRNAQSPPGNGNVSRRCGTRCCPGSGPVRSRPDPRGRGLRIEPALRVDKLVDLDAIPRRQEDCPVHTEHQAARLILEVVG